jgi:hypothetical protein
MSTFGLGIIILQGISRRKSLAGVNIMLVFWASGNFQPPTISHFYRTPKAPNTYTNQQSNPDL